MGIPHSIPFILHIHINKHEQRYTLEKKKKLNEPYLTFKQNKTKTTPANAIHWILRTVLRYPKNLPTLPPIFSKSSRNVSWPNSETSSPSSTCSTRVLPASRSVSAISRCCHAGKRMSLATPRTRTGWFFSGERPATKS